jgi:hypothetical protein
VTDGCGLTHGPLFAFVLMMRGKPGARDDLKPCIKSGQVYKSVNPGNSVTQSI